MEPAELERGALRAPLVARIGRADVGRPVTATGATLLMGRAGWPPASATEALTVRRCGHPARAAGAVGSLTTRCEASFRKGREAS